MTTKYLIKTICIEVKDHPKTGGQQFRNLWTSQTIVNQSDVTLDDIKAKVLEIRNLKNAKMT